VTPFDQCKALGGTCYNDRYGITYPGAVVCGEPIFDALLRVIGRNQKNYCALGVVPLSDYNATCGCCDGNPSLPSCNNDPSDVSPCCPTNAAVSRKLQRKLPSQDNRQVQGSLIDGVLESNFTGATGRIKFGKEIGKDRDSEDIMIGVYNIRPGHLNSRTGMRSVVATLVSVFGESQGWENVAGTRIFYRDGSAVAPEIVREFLDENFITPAVRALGLTLMFLAWLIGATGLFSLWYFGNDNVIVRAQPFFLKLLCIGSIVMSTAIFTLSWDEGGGWIDHHLDVACMLTPWFFFMGHILTFCALFTKLWRLDLVKQVRYTRVAVNFALLPTLVLLTVTLALLIFWTVIDPWAWSRDIIREIPAASYGKCSSKNLWAFLGPLIALLFCAEALTLYFAWRTADVPEDFRDTSTVMYASFAQLQSWTIGGPMLSVLGNSSADAVYFGRVVLIWIFAGSSVLVVVGPKVARAISIRMEESKAAKKLAVSAFFDGKATLRPTRRDAIVGLNNLPSTNKIEGESSKHSEYDVLNASFSLFHRSSSKISKLNDSNDSSQTKKNKSRSIDTDQQDSDGSLTLTRPRVTKFVDMFHLSGNSFHFGERSVKLSKVSEVSGDAAMSFHPDEDSKDLSDLHDVLLD
jgi:7 transmembrane sweet-taste receptor of 3 GCPR